MPDFQLYFSLGFWHIADVHSYDHLLFLVALCAMYQIADWKLLLGLITAFTIGHSTTLALAATRIINPSVEIVEFCIPLTIFLTAFFNIATRSSRRLERGAFNYKYITAGVFGLVHGMGFANDFRAVTDEFVSSIKAPLFQFTLGIETGQVIVIAAILLVSYLFTTLFFFKQHEWNLFVSGIAAGMSAILMANHIFW